jgi:hypothetical protein
MNEFGPRPVLRPSRPPVERPPRPDYAQASIGRLRRAQAVQFTRLMSADVGHFFLKGTVLGLQLLRLFTGGDGSINWDQNIAGLRQDLDEKERIATEQLKAIWQEMSRRRSVRQHLREPHS